MAKRGGYSGQMPGSMQNLMKQAQRMQQKMADMQKDLENQTVEATAGGGAVHVVVNGRKELVSVEIQKEAVDPDYVEMLQDLIVAAVNEAMRNADAMVSQSMSQITGGLNLPGGMF